MNILVEKKICRVGFFILAFLSMRATNKSGSNSSSVIKEGFFLTQSSVVDGPQQKVTKGNINSHVQTWRRGRAQWSKINDFGCLSSHVKKKVIFLESYCVMHTLKMFRTEAYKMLVLILSFI